MRLSFLGAAGTVTGSKYLLETDGARIMVDCGLFQGFKQLRRRNWAPLPVDPAGIDAVVLTHAHIDHSGYIPLLVRNGFSGPVLCTESTRDLCGVLLPDSGFLQEKDAEFANRHGFSKHHPALPLYTRADAERCLASFRPQPFDDERPLPGGGRVRFRRAGHILGAAIVELRLGGLRLVFSGDLGRANSATMHDPAPVREADVLVVESTYGNRRHVAGDPEEALADVVTRTAARGGTVLIPAFAVGRTQSLLYHLWRLRRAGRIPAMPVLLDSPMAIEASTIFCNHVADHRLSAADCRAIDGMVRYVRDAEESAALSGNTMPKILLSASGMATGGRVLHHLKSFAPDPRNTIVISGFQAGGTRGASIAEGAERVKIHGGWVPIRAEVARLDMLSAHADADEIMAWLGHFAAPPARTFVTHGEPEAADTLRFRIENELDWRVDVPEHGETVAFEA